MSQPDPTPTLPVSSACSRIPILIAVGGVRYELCLTAASGRLTWKAALLRADLNVKVRKICLEVYTHVCELVYSPSTAVVPPLALTKKHIDALTKAVSQSVPSAFECNLHTPLPPSRLQLPLCEQPPVRPGSVTFSDDPNGGTSTSTGEI